MFVAQYSEGLQSYHDTLEEAQQTIEGKDWLRIYEVDTNSHSILQNIYPSGIDAMEELLKAAVGPLSRLQVDEHMKVDADDKVFDAAGQSTMDMVNTLLIDVGRNTIWLRRSIILEVEVPLGSGR